MMRLLLRLRASGRHLLIAWHVWRDPALPKSGRLMLIAVGLYLLSPIDLIPDGIPLLGWLDAFALIAFVFPQLLKILPENVLREAQKKAGASN